MAARKRKGLSENTRKRIQTSMIVNRLEDHIHGKVELSATQVSSALGLLKKTLPDLQSIEHSGIIETSPAEMTDEQIIARITELREQSGGTDTAGADIPAETGPKVTH